MQDKAESGRSLREGQATWAGGGGPGAEGENDLYGDVAMQPVWANLDLDGIVHRHLRSQQQGRHHEDVPGDPQPPQAGWKRGGQSASVRPLHPQRSTQYNTNDDRCPAAPTPPFCSRFDQENAWQWNGRSASTRTDIAETKKKEAGKALTNGQNVPREVEEEHRTATVTRALQPPPHFSRPTQGSGGAYEIDAHSGVRTPLGSLPLNRDANWGRGYERGAATSYSPRQPLQGWRTPLTPLPQRDAATATGCIGGMSRTTGTLGVSGATHTQRERGGGGLMVSAGYRGEWTGLKRGAGYMKNDRTGDDAGEMVSEVGREVRRVRPASSDVSRPWRGPHQGGQTMGGGIRSNSFGGPNGKDAGGSGVFDKTAGKRNKSVQEELARVFGHPRFRSGQAEIVQAAMDGSDVLAVMPTGAGKSLCYQLPAYCCPGLAVVFCPLVSLAQDQVRQLMASGVEAGCLNADQTGAEAKDIREKLHNLKDHDGLKLLYITPEKFGKSQSMRDTLEKINGSGRLSRFVIDEAHCLSEWGPDFRPEYLQLETVREMFPNVPIMCLTATATNRVQDDLVRRLNMSSPFVFRGMYDRPNLHYRVVAQGSSSSSSPLAETIRAIKQFPRASGIAYCLSQKDCEKLVKRVRIAAAERSEREWGSGFRVDCYHAGRTRTEREQVQRDWTAGDIHLIIATIAFGMGINKPDVRYVIHASMPKSMTNYYQESGRAGRDGRPAKCIIFFSMNDRKRLQDMVYSSTNLKEDRRSRKIEDINDVVRYCLDEVHCRRDLILRHFVERSDHRQCQTKCDNCIAMQGRPPQIVDETDLAQTFLGLSGSLEKRNARHTLNQLVSVARGTKTTALDEKGAGRAPGAGSCSSVNKDACSRVALEMVLASFLKEVRKPAGSSSDTGKTFYATYLAPGPSAHRLLSGDGKLEIILRPKDKPATRFNLLPSKRNIDSPRTLPAARMQRNHTERPSGGPLFGHDHERPGEPHGDCWASPRNDVSTKKYQRDGPSSLTTLSGPGPSTPPARSSVTPSTEDDTPKSHPWDWARELRKKRPGRLSESLEDNHWSPLENELWSQMDKWRKAQGDSFDILYIMILPEDEMRDIVRVVPTTMDELKTIGIWRATDRHEIHGVSLLAVINDFLQSNNVTLKGEFPRENEA